MKKYNISFLLMLITASLQAQEQEVEMADMMMSDGRIYVVVGVLLVILIGLLLYLISIDRKVGKLENLYKNK